MKHRLALLGLALLLAGPVAAAEDEVYEPEPATGVTPAALNAVAEKLLGAMVVVEYELQFDRGEAPTAYGEFPDDRSVNDLVGEERNLEQPGFFVDATHVLTADVAIHPRFVKSIHVRVGKQRVKATIDRLAKDQPAALLKVAKPVKGAVVLEMRDKVDEDDKAKLLAAMPSRPGADWAVAVSPLSTRVSARKDGPSVRAAGSNRLSTWIVDEDAKLVGATFSGLLPVETAWKGSPLKWPALSEKAVDKLLDGTRKRADASILRVKIHLRSPKQQPGSYHDDEEKTEIQTLAVLTGPKQLLVLAGMHPKVTARLERIEVFRDGGPSIDAAFGKSLKDYGAFTATLPKVLDGAVQLADTDLRTVRLDLLPGVEAKLRGDTRVTYFQPVRIVNCRLGWRDHVYPRLGGRSERMFLFDEKGRLLALPIVRREKGQRERYHDDDPVLTAATYVKSVLADLKNPENVDLSNVPLSEETESRLAWLGVYLQALDEELARENKVAHLTQNGQTGALVSYVYPDSPAGKAGVQPGWLLLRLHSPERPEPIPVRGTGAGSRYFPRLWEQYDRIGEHLYDRIPRPWPGAENPLTRTLTDLGLGKTFTGEFFHDGKVERKTFKVVEGPTHYDTAKRYEDKALGITVRNMTYETNRYFRRGEGDPGVIISRVEPGSKASVTGIRPYELITSVNGQPVHDIDEFQKAVAGDGELRLGVKRWTRGRVVKVKVDR